MAMTRSIEDPDTTETASNVSWCDFDGDSIGQAVQAVMNLVCPTVANGQREFPEVHDV
jgi:hypothetical protein